MEITLQNVLQVIDTGALIFIVYLFLSDQIISTKRADKMTEQMRSATILMAKEITDGMEKAIGDAVKTAILEANKFRK